MPKLRKQRVETVFGTDITLTMCSPGGLSVVAKSNQLPDAVENMVSQLCMHLYTRIVHNCRYLRIILSLYAIKLF